MLFLSPGDLPDSGIEPRSPTPQEVPALQMDSLLTELQGKPHRGWIKPIFCNQEMCGSETFRNPTGSCLVSKVHNLEIKDSSNIPRNPHNFEHWGSLRDVYLQNDFTSLYSATFLLGSNKFPTVWMKRTLWSGYSCAGLSPRKWKRQMVSSLPDLSLPLLLTCFLRSFYHLSAICQEKFCSGSLSKWNWIAFLNPNKLLNDLFYLISV